MGEENQNLDEELKIIVRKNEYYVSKNFICSSVPYFERMFCCDLLESKQNKVELDFDEDVFNIILNWIHSGLLIVQMENVINCYNLADYLMIDEPLFGPCLSYFHEKFTIEHLPVVLPQVTKVSKLINSEAIDYFICRHFLKIINTDVFLDYPAETIEHILKLDLMVHSEYQIFESIMKWVKKNADSRKELLPQLLNCVRWSFMDPVELAKTKDNELIKTMENSYSVISPDCEHGFNRSKQNFFVSIQKLDNAKLRVNVFNNELSCFPVGDFTQDDTMPLEFVHGEHISDILFDTGRKGVRIDWSKKTFRWLDFKVKGKTYYSQLSETIIEFFDSSASLVYLEETKPTALERCDECVFLESVGKYILIGMKDDQKWLGLFPVVHQKWFNLDYVEKRTFHATVLDKIVYMLTKHLEFVQYNYETRSFDRCFPFLDKKWDFNDLLLTSHQSKDDKVILINKSTGKMYVFCISQKKWIEKYRIINVNFCSDSFDVNTNELITFTSTFLQMKNVKPLYRRIFS